MKSTFPLMLCAFVAATSLFGSAYAQDARIETDERMFEYEATVTLTTDYRNRGFSTSNEKPALQGELAISHRSGFHASAWASNTADFGGANVELDLTIGWKHDFGPLWLDVGATHYIFPGVENSSYNELLFSTGRTIGPVDVSANLAWAPRQKNLGNDQNIYVNLAMEWPIRNTPVTLNGSIGLENGYFADRKIDWVAGASYDLHGFDFGVAYMDTAHARSIPYSAARVVGSISKTF
jgi:uncharacterized protein (TIGR02001 family)